MIFLKYILLWFPTVLIAVANGIIRDSLYGRYIGDQAAHQISTASLIVLFSVYVWLVGNRWKLESSFQAWLVGALWAGMTVAFEFLFGHYVMKNPWEVLFHDYNLMEGRVWALIPLWVLIAPALMYWLRTRRTGSDKRP